MQENKKRVIVIILFCNVYEITLVDPQKHSSQIVWNKKKITSVFLQHERNW